MDHYPSCRVPLIRSSQYGDHGVIDGVALTLAEMLSHAQADQTSLAIGLTNALALCLGAMLDKPLTPQGGEILVMLREHLALMSAAMTPLVRTERPITGLTADEPYCVRCSWPKRLCICSVDTGMPHK